MTKSERNSNFEVLRIFAIFTIIAFHILANLYLPDLTAGKKVDEFLYFSTHPYLLSFLNTLITLWHNFGNIVFAMIAGYFLIFKKITWKKIGQTILKFFGIIVGAVVFIIFLQQLLEYIGIVSRTPIFFNISFVGNLNSLWFFGSYVVILAILPLLNLVKRLDKPTFFGILIFTIAISTFLPSTILGLLPNGILFFNLLIGYEIGAFIRLFDPFKNVSLKVMLMSVIIVYFTVFLYIVISRDMTDISLDISFFSTDQQVGIIAFILPVIHFEIFKRIDFHNRYINTVANTVPFIYALHDFTAYYFGTTTYYREIGLSFFHEMLVEIPYKWGGGMFSIQYLGLVFLTTFIVLVSCFVSGYIYNCILPYIKICLKRLFPISFENN